MFHLPRRPRAAARVPTAVRRVLALSAVLAGVLAPPASADLISSGLPDLRIRDGHAVAEAPDGSWRVWDLRKGVMGPRHTLRCGTSRLVDRGRDAGPKGTAYVALTLERVEQATDSQGNLVGLPPEPPTGPEDGLCRPARALLDPDGDGASAPGAVGIFRLERLGRTAVPLPVLQLPAGEAPSGLWVAGNDVWLALQGGDRYVRRPSGAKSWTASIPASQRPGSVDPTDAGGTTMLDDGALWRWTWSELARRATVRVSKGPSTRWKASPKASFTVTNPKPGYKPAEPGACRSPKRVTTGGPATALVDGKGRNGWGVSDGALRWTCKVKRKQVRFERVDVFWLMRTTDGGRRWRTVGRHPVQAPLVGIVSGRPVFEQGASDCPRSLVARRGSSLRPIACATS